MSSLLLAPEPKLVPSKAGTLFVHPVRKETEEAVGKPPGGACLPVLRLT